MKLILFLSGLGLIWFVTSCLLEHEDIMKDSEREK